MKTFTSARKLKVFSKTYDLKFVPNLEGEGTDGNRGALDGQQLFYDEEIRIRKNLPEHIQWRTTWHEALHSILMQIGWPELGSNETFIESISNCVCQVIEDNQFMSNPNLIKTRRNSK